MPDPQCNTVRKAIALGVADENGLLRTHIEQCVECYMFAAEVLRQRSDIAVLLQVEGSAELKRNVMNAISDAPSDGVEIRGVIGMNGNGQLCFFPHSRATGVALFDEFGTVAAARLREAVEAAPARRFTHAEVAALDPPIRAK